MAKCSLR